jgi:hypothetical protein
MCVGRRILATVSSTVGLSTAGRQNAAAYGRLGAILVGEQRAGARTCRRHMPTLCANAATSDNAMVVLNAGVSRERVTLADSVSVVPTLHTRREERDGSGPLRSTSLG